MHQVKIEGLTGKTIQHPYMTDIESIQSSHRLHPHTCRVVLTLYRKGNIQIQCV